METVFCTNGLFSKTLAGVRSLGSHGIRTIVGEKTRWHTSGFSRHCAKTLRYPAPQKHPQLFLEWLRETLSRERCGVLLPMDDDTMAIAVAHQEQLRSYCRLPVPPRESYDIAADKSETLRLAMNIGVPCPKTAIWYKEEEPDTAKLMKLVEGWEYPLVIRPRISSGSRGVRFAADPAQLARTFQTIHAQYPYPIIQEYIPPGPKYDVCVCYDSQHALKAAFIQKEVRNYPIHVGPSTVCESVLYPELLAQAAELMNHLPWYGVADVEFMIDPRNGQPKLMEINPRFWSSLHLSIRCGVDFPWILYQLACGNDDMEPILNYRVGVKGRTVFPGDILHFISNPNRWRLDPPFWSLKIADDILSRDDPWPTIGFMLSALRYSLDKNIWKSLIRR